MRFSVLAPLAALALTAACTTPFEARVARFQQLPAPAGQTFYIQARDASKAGSIEFATYANLVQQRLAQVGYQPAPSPAAASLLVNLDYGVGQPRERIASTPGFGYGFGYPYGGFGYGGFGYGGGFYGRGFYGGGFGFGDPFFGGFGGYPEVYSYTLYPAYLSMRISRVADNTSLFEGRAETQARNNNLTRLVPNLVTAMFTNFPGRSGETVRVTVEPPKHR